MRVFVWILLLLFSSASFAEKDARWKEVEIKDKENGSIKIIVKNSSLYLYWEDEQEQHILHDINRLYIETFKGSYQVLKEREATQVIIIPPRL